MLEAQKAEGQEKLNRVLKLAKGSLQTPSGAEEEFQEILEQEVAILQDEYDSYVSVLHFLSHYH